MNNLEDKKLVEKYLLGDEQALEVLIDRYLDSSLFFAKKLVQDEAVANDIVQISFIKAWKSIRKFLPQYSFQAWLLVIIKNTALDYLRQKQNLPFSFFEKIDGSNSLTDNLTDEEQNPVELLERAEDARYLKNLLLQINPDFAQVLELKNTENLTFKEIAHRLSRPLQTVKSQYRRGLVSLQRLIIKN